MTTMLRLEAYPFVGIYNASYANSFARSRIYTIINILIDEPIELVPNSCRPSPDRDTQLMKELTAVNLDINQVHYGFINKLQLLNWFPVVHTLIKLHQLGVSIAEYNTNPRYDGHTQCAAKIQLNYNSLLRRFSILDLLHHNFK